MPEGTLLEEAPHLSSHHYIHPQSLAELLANTHWPDARKHEEMDGRTDGEFNFVADGYLLENALSVYQFSSFSHYVPSSKRNHYHSPTQMLLPPKTPIQICCLGLPLWEKVNKVRNDSWKVRFPVG